MARPLRIEYPGAFYHVINRGLEKREIYKHDKDREYFLSLFDKLHEKYGVLVYGYVLMSNHYHIYLETPNGHLSKIMRQLDGNYTQKFNKRYSRVGPLMQGRYKATLVDKDNYSLQLLKYIHLNPVKASMVTKPEDYKWSSYPSYLGKIKPTKFLKLDWALSQFSSNRRKAVKGLKNFTEEIDEKPWSPQDETYKGILLGSSDFIVQIQERFLSDKESKEIPTIKAAQKILSPEEIISIILNLKLKSKLAEILIVYALKNHSHLTLKEIGDRIGGRHYSSISQVCIRLENKLKTDYNLASLVKQVDQLCKMSKIQT